MFDWDDLRIFVSAARAGSLGGASKQLGIDAATVGRRVARLESALKATLLTRSTAGLQLTAAGDQLLRVALDAETAMLAAADVGQADLVGGTVRISTAEGFGTAIVAPALPALIRQRPGLRIELAAHAGFLSPSRREVDMAVTFLPQESARVVIEPLTDYHLALYASRDYLARAGTPATAADLGAHQIVGYVDDLLYAAELRYLDEVAPNLVPTISCTSIQAQRTIVAAGGGIGVLHGFMAEGLVRVLPNILLKRRFWLSTHRDVYETARVKVVRNWLLRLVADKAALLRPA